MSPAGTALLAVLTTLLLAGTVALSLGGVGDDSRQVDPPSATLAFDYVETPDGNESVLIKHVRGDHINPEQLLVEVSGATCAGGGPNGVYNGLDDFGLGTECWLAAGNSLVLDSDNPEQLCPGGQLQFDDAAIDVVWENHSGSDVTVASWGAGDE